MQSPPLFCAATKTATVITNLQLKCNWQPGPHRLDELANSQPAPKQLVETVPSTTALPVPEHLPIREWKPKALAKFDVFVDDFIGVGQGDPARLKEIQQVLLHTIDELFSPVDDQDSEHHNSPSSTKKLSKGNAPWATQKSFCGGSLISWIDIMAMTIVLPPHWQARLCKILDNIKPGQKRTLVQK
jgi:hypothetical protein